MKRTCNYCRALSGEHCSLGYKNVMRPGEGVKSRDHSGYFHGMKPAEDCPKPRTYRDYFVLLDQRNSAITNVQHIE